MHIQATKDNDDKKRKNKNNSDKNNNKKKKKEEAGESASAASAAAAGDGGEGDENENEDSEGSDDGGWGARKRAPRKKIKQTIRCNDGFSMSVQASREHYCTPHNDEGPYTHVEVGYPNELDERLMPYADNSDDFQIVGMRSMLYINVPAHVICSVIFQHGDKYSGQLPNMVNVGEDGVQWAAAAVPPSSTEEEETEEEEEGRNEDMVGSPSSAVHMGAAPPPPPPTHTQVGAMTPPTPLTRLVLSPIERTYDEEEF